MRRKPFLCVMYSICGLFLLSGTALTFWDCAWLQDLDTYLSPAIGDNTKWIVGIAASFGSFWAVLEGYKEMRSQLTRKEIGYVVVLWTLWAWAVVGGALRALQLGRASAVQFICYVLTALVLIVVGLVEKLRFLRR